jgi:ADP-heptose:LPS heptosyltransferase
MQENISNDPSPGTQTSAGKSPGRDLRPGRIVVLRALQLGDMLCAVPALRALRSGFPEAHITLVGLPWAAELASRPGTPFDDFVPLPGFPGFPEQECAPDAIPAFLLDVQSRQPDLVLQIQGDGSIANVLAALLGGRRTGGFYLPGRYRPDPELFLPYPESGPEIRRLLALPAFLGLAGRGEQLEFSLCRKDYEQLARRGCLLRPGSYACLHAGARTAARRWDPEAFARVGDRLAARGLTVVLTGTAAERPLTARVAAQMRLPAVDLAGRTTLGSLAALLKGARLLVSNDTGVAHLATAVDIPSVVLFEPSQIERWAPLDGRRHRVVAPVAAATPDEVMEAVAELVGDEPALFPPLPGAAVAAAVAAVAAAARRN